jgi:hypothetical protein
VLLKNDRISEKTTDGELSISCLANDTDELVKKFKDAELKRFGLIESFTRKVEAECTEFVKAVVSSLEESNSGKVEVKMQAV